MSETVHNHWSDIRHWMRPGTLQLQGLPPLSLYIHLPWCLKKCPYCDFNSHEWSATSAARSAACLNWAYLDALRADLESALPLIWGRPGAQRLHRTVARPACFRLRRSTACWATCVRC